MPYNPKSKKQLNPWKTLKSEQVYENAWIKVDHKQVVNPKGGHGIYGVVHFKNLAIGILPIDDQGNTWLVGQYRFPLEGYSWEIPEGGGPLNIDPLISAKRELLEETGLIAQEWNLLMHMHLSNSVTNEHAIIYTAQDLTQHLPEPEETEDLTLLKLPFVDALTWVIEGKITDSMSVAAILKYAYLNNIK